MTEEWRQVSQEIIDLFDDADVSEACRDVCVHSIWKAKRAIFYGRQAVQNRRKAWELIYALYPDMEGRDLQFRADKKGVRFHPGIDAASSQPSQEKK